MNVSSSSSTPGNVGASTASSSNSSPYADYLNGSQRGGSSARPTNNASSGSANLASSPDNPTSSSKASGLTSSLIPNLEPTDHLQRLAQMTQGVGLVKSESDSGTSSSVTAVGLTTDPFHSAAAAYVQQYGSWQNYYQQFGPPMAPTTGFSNWAQCYPPGHWQNYAQTKKGRQTYQRYQTSVLESKFQQSSYVSKKQREELRLQTNLTDRQIKIWFQNRRMKAKKEKNRCEEQNDHSTLLPSNNSAKSLNNSLSSLNGTSGTNGSGNLMSGGNLGMIGGPQLLNEEALMNLVDHEDSKQQLKMVGLHNGMMPNSTITSPMWSTTHSVHAAAGVMLNTDPINAWPQILPQSTHSQPGQYTHMQSPYLPYPICPPNI